jgi:hypothetical protein
LTVTVAGGGPLGAEEQGGGVAIPDGGGGPGATGVVAIGCALGGSVEPGIVAIGGATTVRVGAATVGRATVGATATDGAGSSHPFGIDLPVAGAMGSSMEDRKAMPAT